METIIFERDDYLAIITINRPQFLNALNQQALKELENVLDNVENDSEIRVVIITGAGEKSFIAGADVSEMRDFAPDQARAFSRRGHALLNRIERLPQPTIAAINGYALGGGCELAMACDLRVASEKAILGQPEVGLAVIPGFAGTQRLPRLIGKALAKELLFTGESINAERAREIGLVNRVVPADQLMNHARELAAKIASQGKVAVRLTKQAVNQGMEMDSDRAMDYEAGVFALCFTTDDQKEGMGAFLERRKPQFTGK